MALRPPLKKKKHGGPLLIQFLECGKLSNRFPNITINDGLKKTSHKSPTNYGIPWHNILHIPRFVAFGLPRDRHDPIQATNSACICNSKAPLVAVLLQFRLCRRPGRVVGGVPLSLLSWGQINWSDWEYTGYSMAWDLPNMSIGKSL